MTAAPDVERAGEDAIRLVVIDGPVPVHESAARLRELTQPVVARVRGACWVDAGADTGADTLAVLDACDIVLCADDATFLVDGQTVNAQAALAKGWVTLCVAPLELDARTDELVRELASKDALTLRFTKETLRRVPTVPWDEVLAFTSATQATIKALQADMPSTRASAIASFLAGKSKPGAGV